MSLRVAILADALEEGWTSMDHYAAMLQDRLALERGLTVTTVRPTFHRRWSEWPGRHGETLDRYLHRYVDYPGAVSQLRDFDLFHVVDQTYAHVARRLPAAHTIVTCHDLDFMQPPAGTRNAWLVRATGAWAAPGLRHAARVLCDSAVVRDEIVRRGLADPERLRVVPLGVEDEFRPDGPQGPLPAPVESALQAAGDGPIVLHVGAMIARKRIDLLLQAFAAVRARVPDARLVRAGGALSPAMAALAQQLGIAHALITMPFLQRHELAALYRRAAVCVSSSDSEGFGLPVLEAMASGTPVVAREVPTVREVAGNAIMHVAADDQTAFAAAIVSLLQDANARAVLRATGLERAAGYRWTHTAEATVRVYRELLPADERRT